MVESTNNDPCEEKEFAPRYQQKKINVFVSSTFRDMMAERDELTLRVFPALRKVCEERGIGWGEVDLRWGIPEERKGEVLSTCLKFIDDCRPYFIGMLGERYGWVEKTAPEGVIKDYSWITEHKGKSITELEILHGVLNNPAMAGHAYFYFRDPAYIKTLPEIQQSELLESPTDNEIADYGPEDAEKRAEHRKDQLVALKKRIKKSGLPYHENYRDPVQFGELVQEDLMRAIDALAPPPKPLSDAERASATLDREDMTHEIFAASRFGVYIPRQEYFERLDAHVTEDSPPLVVLGDSGSGKSALLAHWAVRYRCHHPDDLVLVHFVGASSESTDWTDMLRRFMGEFKRKFNIAEEIPAQDDALMAAFRNWLSMAAAQGRVVLVIDALNQIEDRNGAPDLVWLPPMIPGNIRLILSTLEGRPLDAVRKRGWYEMTVEPLTVSERKALITCYLKKYHKELSSNVKEELASAPQCENPLFLRALLEEVRIHGVFENLVDQIQNYLTAQTGDALFEMILARYEHDYERDRCGLVKDAVSLLWAARRGLSKSELMDLLGTDGKPLPSAYWAPLYLAMEHSLVEKDGRITFFHDYLRTAVEHRYLPTVELKRTAHLRVADYFDDQPECLRRTEELPWQLAEAAKWDRLVGLLINPSFFTAAWDIQEYDVKRYWVQIESGSSHRMVEAYQSIIREPARVSSLFVNSLLGLLYDTGHLDEASALVEYLIKSSKELGDLDSLQAYFGYQALILKDRGDLDGAMALYKEKERICHKTANLYSLELTLGNQAVILFTRNDLDGAMILLKEQERICRELGEKAGLMISLGNQSTILTDRGDLDGAIALYKEQERICRELGDVNSLEKCLGGQANVLYSRGDLDSAMALYKEQERICRELGDVDSLQAYLGNQANVLYSRGDLDGAMALYKEQEGICRELGKIDSLRRSLGNQAVILKDCGDFDGAMALLKEEEQIYRKLKNITDLKQCLCEQGRILLTQGDFDNAMNLFKEQEQICRELGDVDSLQNCLGSQARILTDMNDLNGALALYKEQERICRKIGKEDRIL
jgi:tetratricopeptide (TPR) repeat protein